MSLSALFYFVLLMSPLAFVSTANAASNQDPLQESYGTGTSPISTTQKSLTELC